MLALSRRLHEGIVLRHNGKRIGRLSVERIRPGQVRLAFDFLDEIEINRDEWDKRLWNGDVPRPSDDPMLPQGDGK